MVTGTPGLVARQAPLRRSRPAVRRHLAPPDGLLALACAVLFAVGCLAVYAATRDGLRAQGRPSGYYLQRDLVNGVIALLIAGAASRWDLRGGQRLLPLLYGLLVLAMLAVLTPLGATINGAHAWFKLGPLELEPSEAAKLLLVLLGAALLSARGPDEDADDPPAPRDALRLVLATGPLLLLVLVEPALGVALVLVVVLVALLAMSGLPARFLLLLLLAGGLAVGGAVGAHLVKPYQEQRFTAFLQPQADPSGVGYHLQQSELAIGDGGLTGRGFLQGSQTNGGFVPEQQTDFVFSVIGEEAGLAGTAVVLGALGLLLLRGVSLVRRAADRFDALVASGVVAWLGFQAFINVGMTLGLAPVTGLPLPFVSYGGSALFASAAAVGLLQGVARRAKA